MSRDNARRTTIQWGALPRPQRPEPVAQVFTGDRSFPPPDHYDNHPLVAAHFARTPPLTDIDVTYIEYPTDEGDGGQAERWRGISPRLVVDLRALCMNRNVFRTGRLGLYHAGSEEQMSDLTRERVMLLVVELPPFELYRWYVIHGGVMAIMNESGLSACGVCVRYYRADTDLDVIQWQLRMTGASAIPAESTAATSSATSPLSGSDAYHPVAPSWTPVNAPTSSSIGRAPRPTTRAGATVTRPVGSTIRHTASSRRGRVSGLITPPVPTTRLTGYESSDDSDAPLPPPTPPGINRRRTRRPSLPTYEEVVGTATPLGQPRSPPTAESYPSPPASNGSLTPTIELPSYAEATNGSRPPYQSTFPRSLSTQARSGSTPPPESSSRQSMEERLLNGVYEDAPLDAPPPYSRRDPLPQRTRTASRAFLNSRPGGIETRRRWRRDDGDDSQPPPRRMPTVPGPGLEYR